MEDIMLEHSTRLWLIIAIIFVSGCARKIPESVVDDFEPLIQDLQENRLDASSITWYGRQYELQYKEIPLTDLATRLEKAAEKLKVGEVSKVISAEDGACGVVKLREVGESKFMRVRYIYLEEFTEEGENIADELIGKYAKGEAFATLARQYSKDPVAEWGGDLGWFNAKSMIADFSNAIDEHRTGEVFKVKTEAYGWYVIKKTHDSRMEKYIKFIEVKKINCH